MVTSSDHTKEPTRAPGSKLRIIELPEMISAKKKDNSEISTQAKYFSHLFGASPIVLLLCIIDFIIYKATLRTTGRRKKWMKGMSIAGT
jgi:hypothetical protein